MKNYIKKFFSARNEIIADEEHFTDVLDLLAQYRICDKLKVTSFDWGDSKKWGVMFKTSGRKMESIEQELKDYKNRFGDIITIKDMKKSEVMTRVI